LDKTAATAEDNIRARAEADYDGFVRTHLRRNYAANLLHGLLGQTGFRLVQAPTFVPAYIFLLSGSELAVGIALAAQWFGAALSSVQGATLIEHRKRVVPVGIAIGALMRLQVLGLALTGLIVPDAWAFPVACLFMLLFGYFNGMQAVMFNYLMGKVIPVDVRGRLTGLRNFLAGLTSAGVAYFGGRYLVENNVLGNGYSTTFLIAFGLTTLGLAMLLFIKEPEPPEVRPKANLWGRLRDVGPLLRSDPAYTSFMIARALAALGTVAVPFYILYAGKVVGLSGVNLGILSIAFLLCQTATNLLWGSIADRAGNRLVFMSAMALWALSTFALIYASELWMLVVVFAGLGAGQGGFQNSSINIVLEFGAREDLPMRIAVSNMAQNFMMGVGPLAGGIIAAETSFQTVFWIAIVVQFASVATVLFFVDEPRRRGAAAG